MHQSDQLREMVARLLLSPADQIGPDTSLVSLDTSLGGAKLRLGLKRLGLVLPNGSSPATFAQLETALFGNSANVSVEPPVTEKPVVVKADSRLTGVQVGLDVQDIHSLPVAADYWVDDFYTATFAKSEIAYAVVESEPRIHFAGFWCAKEALRKCDPSFARVPFEAIVVQHGADGKPYLSWQNGPELVRLSHALSLSHTGALATAIVVTVALPPPEPKPLAGPASMPVATESTKAPAVPSRSPTILFAASVFLIIGAIVYLLIHWLWSAS